MLADQMLFDDGVNTCLVSSAVGELPSIKVKTLGGRARFKTRIGEKSCPTEYEEIARIVADDTKDCCENAKGEQILLLCHG